MRLVDLRPDDAEPVRLILNDAIENTTAIYDDQPRSLDTVRDWIGIQLQNGRPLVGLLDEREKLCGYGTYGTFRTLSGYRLTVEHSIYVLPSHHRRGGGRLLLDELTRRATAAGLHGMVGVIDSENAASRRLHEKAGFALIGTMPEAAIKFGRWLDVCFYHRLLK